MKRRGVKIFTVALLTSCLLGNSIISFASSQGTDESIEITVDSEQTIENELNKEGSEKSEITEEGSEEENEVTSKNNEVSNEEVSSISEVQSKEEQGVATIAEKAVSAPLVVGDRFTASITVGSDNNAPAQFYLSNIHEGVRVVSIEKFVDDYQATGKMVIPASVTGPDGLEYKVTHVGTGGMWGTAGFDMEKGITEVVIPEGVHTIGSEAFWGSSNISKVSFPDSLTKIESSAFYGCDEITSIHIPKNVGSWGIDAHAFGSIDKLQEITVAEGNTNYKSVDGVLFEFSWRSGELYELIQYPIAAKQTSYEVPNGVQTIDHGAFEDAKSLVSVKIANTVNNIENQAFLRCTNLKSIEFPKNVYNIGWQAFEDCTALDTVVFNENLENQIWTKLAENPDEKYGVVNYSAFSGCTSLDKIIVNGTQAAWNNYKSYIATSGNENLLNITPEFRGTPVTIDTSQIVLNDKTYDGTAITYTGTATVSGSESIELNYDWYQGSTKLASAPINAGEYELVITPKSSQYHGEAVKTVTIEKATLTDEDFITGVLDYKYDGIAKIASVSAKEGIIGIGGLVVKYNGKTDLPVEVGTYAVTYEVGEGMNYEAKASTSVGSFKIEKADKLQLTDVNIQLYYKESHADKTVDIKLPENVGTKSFVVGSIVGEDIIDGQVQSTETGVKFSTVSGAAGDSVTIPITVEMKNYQDSSVNVVVTLVDKTPVEIKGIDIENKVYDGKPLEIDLGTITTTPEYAKELDVKWSTPDGKAPTKAGVYSVTVKVPESDETYTGEFTQDNIMITQKEIIVKPKNVTIYNGDNFPNQFEIEYLGAVQGEVVTLEQGNVAFEVKDGKGNIVKDSSVNGVYEISIKDADTLSLNSANYKLKIDMGQLMVLREGISEQVPSENPSQFDYNSKNSQIAISNENLPTGVARELLRLMIQFGDEFVTQEEKDLLTKATVDNEYFAGENLLYFSADLIDISTDTEVNPNGPITIFIPYSQTKGIIQQSTVQIAHLKNDNTVEIITPEMLSTGMQFTVTEFSPFVVGYNSVAIPNPPASGNQSNGVAAATGDDSNIGIWLVLAILAFTGGVLVVTKRKSRYRR